MRNRAREAGFEVQLVELSEGGRASFSVQGVGHCGPIKAVVLVRR